MITLTEQLKKDSNIVSSLVEKQTNNIPESLLESLKDLEDGLVEDLDLGSDE